MKKTLKILLIVFLSIITVIGGFCIYSVIYTNKRTLDEKKLISVDNGIIFYDNKGEKIEEISSGKKITPIEEIPNKLINAFIAIEDKRFYKHHGVDHKGILRACVNNLKSFSFKEGASTISQQLIKNTHLSSEKTINRKLLEIKLAKELEKKYSKNEILEIYLNTIYFGNNCYGIYKASNFYFDKPPIDLNLNECAILAGLVKAPNKYSPIASSEKCFTRKNIVLEAMLKQGYISKNEYSENVNKEVKVISKKQKNYYDYLYLAKNEVDEILNRYPFGVYQKIKVYTYLDNKIQSNIIENFNDEIICNKSVIILNKNNEINGYLSTCGESWRNLGSAIKPLVVYAPAIQEKIIYPCSKILDEKTDFNGYSPDNYNSKYYGQVSVKTALEKSLNVPSVKLLSYLGVKQGANYGKKLGININEQDENLSLALGCISNGETLKNLTSAYTVFLNNGSYQKSTTINKVTVNNSTVYQDNRTKSSVFDDETVFLINDMLKGVVNNGTAKKLSFINLPLYSKTGTCGNESGNTDAYSISYTPNQIIGVWYGSEDNKILDNNVTGGSYPTITAGNIWKNLECLKQDFEKCSTIKELYIDSECYDEENRVVLADENTPEMLKQKEYFRTDYYPQEVKYSTSYLNIETPKLSVNKNEITIRLCLTKYQNILIYRINNAKKELVYNSRISNTREEFIDVLPNDILECEYTFIPYIINNGEDIMGEEKIIGKIKQSPNVTNDDWWLT